MLAVSASCCLHTLAAPEHVSMILPLALLCLLLPLFLLLLPLLLLLLPCVPPSSLVFFCCSSPSSLGFFFCLLLLLLLSAVYMSGPRASRKSAVDSCTCTCARSFPDHRRLHSMQSTSAVCGSQAGLRYAQNCFPASYLISLLLAQCFTAL